MAKKEAVKENNAPVKNPALESALAQIQKQFGKEAIMKMGDGSQQNIEAISSGSLGLDIALGIGGYPRGRIVEIYVRLLHARNDLIGYGVDAVGVFRYAIKLIISRKRFVVIVQHIRHPFRTESGGKKRNVDDFLIRVEYDAVVVSVPLASRKGKRSQGHAERKQPNQNFFHVFSPYALISNTLAEYFCFMVTMNFSPSIRKGTLMPEG